MLELNFISSDAKNRKRFENEANLKLELIVENIAPGTFKSESLHDYIVESYKGTQDYARLTELQALAKTMTNTYTDQDIVNMFKTIATYYPQMYFDLMTIIESVTSAENFSHLADYAELFRREIAGEVNEHFGKVNEDPLTPERPISDDNEEMADEQPAPKKNKKAIKEDAVEAEAAE